MESCKEVEEQIKYDFNEVVKRLYFFILENKENIPCYNSLSKREIDVITLKMAGYKISDIGSKLNIKEKTVKFHYHRICNTIHSKLLERHGPQYLQQKVVFVHLFYQNLLKRWGVFDIRKQKTEECVKEEYNKEEYNKNNFLPKGDGNA